MKRETEIQNTRDDYIAECQRQIQQAIQERDNAIRKANETANKCSEDNRKADEYKQKAKQEFEKFQSLKSKQQFLITEKAEKKVAQIRTELEVDYKSKLDNYKLELDNQYLAREGCHIFLAVCSLMIILFHALWLDSFRNDLLNAIIGVYNTMDVLSSAIVKMFSLLWNWFTSFDNIVATVLGGIILNILLIILVFGGGLIGIFSLLYKGWKWFKPRFINKKSGYICLGILFGVVIFSDMIKMICSLNIILLLLLINIVVFVTRYFIKDYKEPPTWCSY